MSNRVKLIFLLLFLLAFRTLFGLSMPFYGAGEIDRDALQTYLIGLKCYTTNTWPYFGPDQYLLDTGFHSQMPGALEGLVIGLPFYLLPVPEAPFLMLNLLSLTAIALLAWYITCRLPELSFPFVLTWIGLLPWTLNESTHIYNISFLLFGSVLFFVGFLEALPGFSLGRLSPGLAFGLMGIGLFWNLQFHYSWILLPPFILAAFFLRRRGGLTAWGREILGFVAGAALPLAFLVPTFVRYGFQQESGGFTGVAMGFSWDNFCSFFTILARYLSFPCFEMPRFLGSGTQERLEFLKRAPWLIPPAIFLTLIGWFQPFVLLIYGWFKDSKHGDARDIHRWTMIGFFWIWVCFWFTSKQPASRMYYLFLPLVTVYYFYLWSRLVSRVGCRRFAAACLIASLWFQSGYMARMIKDRSLYTDRHRIVKALQEKDYHILYERRPWALY
ncbi:MAG TPA: hypothetical protein VIJ93_02150 [bacterium]